MKRIFVCLSLMVTVVSALADNLLPRDVQKFVDRREGCDHMRGEIPDPSEKRRMNEVAREINKLCAGSDKELAQLKRKYAANSTIMQILMQFEAGIEAAEAPAPKSKVGSRAG